MNETSPEAKSELVGWIETSTLLKYELKYQTLTPYGIEGMASTGTGVLSQHREDLITLQRPDGQVLAVTDQGREIIDYCEAYEYGHGYRVQVRSVTYDTLIAFRASS